jgi:hypothetical protein
MQQDAWLVRRAGRRRFGLFRGPREGKQLARSREVGGAVAFGKQPVVTDAMQALRENVDQEAPDVASG